jgi:hypothetical protein
MQNGENWFFFLKKLKKKKTKPPFSSLPSHFGNLAEEGELCNNSHGSKGCFGSREFSSGQPVFMLPSPSH